MPKTTTASQTIKSGERKKLKRGERIRWEISRGGKPGFAYTAKNLYDVLDSDGHQADIEIVHENYWLRCNLRCSCGHTEENVSMTWGGKFASYAVARWQGHKDKLAAPLLVWEGTATRVKYKCYIACGASAARLMDAHDASRYQSFSGSWGERFCVIRTSESLTSGKVSSRRWMNVLIGLPEAMQYAKKLGLAAQHQGHTVTWVEESPVTKPTGEATAIIAAINQADDPGSIMQAIKLADAYLDYADAVRESKEAALQRFHELLSTGDD